MRHPLGGSTPSRTRRPGTPVGSRGEGERTPPRRGTGERAGVRSCAVPELVRTPEDAFANLPDFPFAPHYREVEGLRLAHIDEGEGAPVLFMHGEPTWSFLWRRLIPPVRDAGYRCDRPRHGRVRPLGQADGHRLVLLRSPRRATRRRSSRISTCATPRSSCTTGAGRSGCAWRSSTPSASTHRDPRHGPAHRPSAHAPTRGWRSATSPPAPRTCRSACWCAAAVTQTPAMRSSPRMRPPIPTPPPRPARARFPELVPHVPRRARRRRGEAGAERAAR